MDRIILHSFDTFISVSVHFSKVDYLLPFFDPIALPSFVLMCFHG